MEPWELEMVVGGVIVVKAVVGAVEVGDLRPERVAGLSGIG